MEILFFVLTLLKGFTVLVNYRLNVGCYLRREKFRTGKRQ